MRATGGAIGAPKLPFELVQGADRWCLGAVPRAICGYTCRAVPNAKIDRLKP